MTPNPSTTAQKPINPNGSSPPIQQGWKIFTLADAYIPRLPVVYLIENILELPSLNMVYGAPSSLKSFILADMAICIATGCDWLNPPSTYSPIATGSKSNPQKCKPKATSQCSVLWIDFDNGERRTHERFDMLGKGHNIPDTTPLFYTSMPSPPLMLNNDASLAYLTSIIKASNAKLVIIDNLGTVAGAKVDENSADMVLVMFNLRKVVEGTGAAIIVIHHQRKANGFKTRIGETLRGHSSIEASLDLALLVERDPGSKEIRIQSTKSRGIDVKPFGAIFEHVKDTQDIESARFYGTFIEDTNSDEAIRQAIIDVVTANMPGINQKDIVEEVKGLLDDPGVHRIKRLLQALVAEGKLDTVPAGKNSKFYIIP
jgi:predicted ATP-dependent serine protease